MQSTFSLPTRLLATTGEEILQQAATDGFLNVAEWPRVLETVLARLNHIVHNDFPSPSISRPQPRPPLDLRSSPPDGYGDKASDTGSNHATPGNSAPSSPIPHTPLPSSTPNPPDTATTDLPEGTIPPPLLATLTYIKNALETNFDKNPPHTIQRLAELILFPRRHYRYLPAYLNALDRVVAVSSGTSFFPLPTSDVTSTNPILANGNVSTPIVPSTGLGSDESLGGALLTPIPWLKADRDNAAAQQHAQVNGINSNGTDSSQHGTDNDTIMSGDDTMSSSSSSSSSGGSMRQNGAITQGELLRQQQETNGPPAAVASAQNQSHIVRTDGGEQRTGDALAVEQAGGAEGSLQQQPHARGPDMIGMEDTGRQEHAMGGGQVLDMEAAVGRSASTSTTSPSPSPTPIPSTAPHTSTAASAPPPIGPENQEQAKETQPPPAKDEEGDVLITDADGLPEDPDRRLDADMGANTAPDAVDTTGL